MNNISNLKKAITMIAVGFVFNLVNLNLKFGDLTINVTPDFVGWLLFFLSFEKLGDYAKGKEYLRWMALVMMFFSIFEYVVTLIQPGIGLSMLKTAANICEMIFTYLFLGMIELIAEDIGSSQVQRIHTVRIVNVAAYMMITILTMFMTRVGVSEVIIILFMSIVLMIIAILTVLALLKLRKEISLLEAN